MSRLLLIVTAVVVAVLAGYVSLDDSGVRGVRAQSFHYLARPNSGDVLRQPLTNTRAAWRSESLPDAEWRYQLNSSEIESCLQAVARWQSLNRSLSTMRAADVPDLAWLTRFRTHLDPESPNALGFVLISGAPVQRWTLDESRVFFWALGLIRELRFCCSYCLFFNFLRSIPECPSL